MRKTERGLPLNRRFLIRVAICSVVFYLVLLWLQFATYIITHFPPALLHLDGLILFLTRVQEWMMFPRWALRHLWFSETTPAALNWVLGLANSLTWGLLLATLKTWRNRRHG